MANPLQSAGKVIDSWLYLIAHGPTSLTTLAEAMDMTDSQARSAVATLKSRGMAHNGDGIVKPDIPLAPMLETYETRLQRELSNVRQNLESIRHYNKLTSQPHTPPPGAGCNPDRSGDSAAPWSPARIKAFRKSLGYSQRMAAEEWGIPSGTISAVESGKKKPTVEMLTKLEEVSSAYEVLTK